MEDRRQKHHGDLRVESVPGDTRFIVLLPLEMPPAVDVALPSDGDGGDDNSAKKLANLRPIGFEYLFGVTGGQTGYAGTS